MVVPLTLLTSWRLRQLMPRAERWGLGEANRLILAASTLNMVLPSKMGDIVKAYFMGERGHLEGEPRPVAGRLRKSLRSAVVAPLVRVRAVALSPERFVFLGNGGNDRGRIRDRNVAARVAAVRAPFLWVGKPTGGTRNFEVAIENRKTRRCLAGNARVFLGRSPPARSGRCHVGFYLVRPSVANWLFTFALKATVPFSDSLALHLWRFWRV